MGTVRHYRFWPSSGLPSTTRRGPVPKSRTAARNRSSAVLSCRSFRAAPVSGRLSSSEPPQNLRHPGPTDAEMACKSCSALELSSIEKCLIVEGKFQRLAAFLEDRLWLRFGVSKAVPGEDGNDGRST